jgi:molybdenum-dependent DNA-binding transcriptional regulator ModE
MVRQYIQVTDEQRRQLVRLIHDKNYSIAKAAKTCDIPYDNAKAINRTYLKESRVKKINYQQRYQKAKLNLSRKKAVAQQRDSSLEQLGQLLSDSSESRALSEAAEQDS